MAIKLPEIKFAGISLVKPRDAFAVDIGTHSIKVAYLKKDGNRFSLQKWGIIPVSGENSSERSPQDRKNIAISQLAEYLAKEKIPTKNVISSVSGNQVIVRYVKLPKLSREELNKTVRFEAEPYIPFDINEVELGYHILGDVVEDGQKKMETILVAAKKEAVQAKLEILTELNLRPVIMDIDAFALANAYEANGDKTVQETVLIINIGATATNMSIVENSAPRVVRDVLISGNSFTRAIQRSFSCDMKTAEELKSGYGFLVTAEEKEHTLAENQKEALQVSSAITPVAKDLLAEIQKSIDFYISQNPERSIHRVLLCGGSSNLKSLDRFLHQELRITVGIFNPLATLQNGASVPAESASQLAVAVGLGMRHENDVPRK